MFENFKQVVPQWPSKNIETELAEAADKNTEQQDIQNDLKSVKIGLTYTHNSSLINQVLVIML